MAARVAIDARARRESSLRRRAAIDAADRARNFDSPKVAC
jgi:hypothetical protein